MKNLAKSVSIIIRTKNEAKWINSCLKVVKKQEFDQKKIQIIVLDNNSVDGTIDIVNKFNVKLIKYNPQIYLPGHALNYAIKKAKNEIVVFLSAHCIPTSNKWLKNLINSFEDETAAVYGKQLPYSFSSFKDKRDLFNQFGLERRVQKKDNFFHNANSAILKKLLIKYPFDNKIKHIEDRVWAKNILKKNYNIVYEPKASVWHYHGLNHSNDEARSLGVGKILQDLIIKETNSKASIHSTHNLLKIISHNPIINSNIFLKNLKDFKKLIGKKNSLGETLVLSSDKNVLSKIKNNFNFQTLFVKNKKLRLIKKVKKGLINFEKKNKIIIDAVMIVDVIKTLKNSNEYKKLFEKFFSENYNVVIPIKKDYEMYWKKNSTQDLIRLDDADKIKKDKEPLYKGLNKVASVISPSLIFKEKNLGDQIGCIIVK